MSSNGFMYVTKIEYDVICTHCGKLLLPNSFGVIFDNDVICSQCAFKISTITIEEIQKFLIELSPFIERIEEDVEKSTRT